MTISNYEDDKEKFRHKLSDLHSDTSEGIHDRLDDFIEEVYEAGFENGCCFSREIGVTSV